MIHISDCFSSTQHRKHDENFGVTEHLLLIYNLPFANYKTLANWDFPGVVRLHTPLNARGISSIPGQGTKTPYGVVWPRKYFLKEKKERN